MEKALTLPEVSDLFSESFEIFKKNWKLLVGIYLTIFALSILLSAMSTKENPNAIINLLSYLLSILVTIGTTMVNLKLVRSQKAEFEDLYIHYKKIPGLFVLSVIVTVLIFLGLIALIIPGIYLCLRFIFTNIAKIDKDISIKESMALSTKITNGIKLKLLFYGIIFGFVNLLGLLCLGVGVLVTAPVTSLAFTKIYLNLIDQVKDK